MAEPTFEKRRLHCDTCGRETEHLHRDVLDRDYDAILKPPVWNCEACYRNKRASRLLGGKRMHVLRGRQIYLTGFMATGKSRIGPILAHLLDRAYVDTDDMVVETAGKPIPHIFRVDGEAVFRELEHDCIVRTVEMPDAVVALGGGAVTQERNWEVIRRAGVCVCLRATPETIYDRVTRRLSEKERPILDGLDDEARMQKIRTLLTEREPSYAQADVFVESRENQSPEETTVDAVRAIWALENEG